MTEKKLEELNQLLRKIKLIKADLKYLEYMKDNDYLSITCKDGQKMYDSYISVRIPRSLRALFCNEIQNKLEIELKSLEQEFEQEG